MTIYRFDRFEFNSNSYELHSNGIRIALRPKTAVLITLLLENRRHLLSKQMLFEQVWHSGHVQDQSLFQAISEIRKVFAPLQPIKTHPNLGYQWVTPVNVRAGFRNGWRLAAGLSACAVVLIVSLQSQVTQDSSSSTNPGESFQVVQSPAMQAFSTGIKYLKQQQLADAWHFFDLAERENPLLLEAGMMKAEILYKQSDYQAAQSLAQIVLERAVSSGERYVEVAAQSLLSRISEQNGQLQSALEWALEADNNARDQGFACVAENTRNRIAGLLATPEPPVNESWLMPQTTAESWLANDLQSEQEYPDASHCQQLDQSPDDVDIKPDLSHCDEPDAGYQLYAANDLPGFRQRWFGRGHEGAAIAEIA